MITKERLEELIEKGAEIWKIEDGIVYPLRKDHYEYWRIKEDRLEWYWKIVPSGFNYISFEHLFETKADAEEYAEFGNITRTERLELPTFDELFDEIFAGSFGIHTIQRFDNVQIRYKLLLSGVAWLFVVKGKDELFTSPLSRENYNEARRLCVKLFKGE